MLGDRVRSPYENFIDEAGFEIPVSGTGNIVTRSESRKSVRDFDYEKR